MIHKVCSVYDRAVEAFGRPIFAPAVGAAVRSLADEVNRGGEDNQMSKHSKDFVLYDLGVFDDSTGEFHLEDRPKMVCEAASLKTGGLNEPKSSSAG